MPGSPRAGLEGDADRLTRASSGASISGSWRTAPVKYSAGAFIEGRDPGDLVSIVLSFAH